MCSARALVKQSLGVRLKRMSFSVKYKVKIIVKILAVVGPAWHEGCSPNRSWSENLEWKGGESNEEKPITSMQPSPLLSAVLRRVIRGSRRDDLQRSHRHHRVLSSKVPGDA